MTSARMEAPVTTTLRTAVTVPLVLMDVAVNMVSIELILPSGGTVVCSSEFSMG